MMQDDMYKLLQKSNQRSKGFEKFYNNGIAVIDKGLKENIEVKNAISKGIFYHIYPPLLIALKLKNETDMLQNKKTSSIMKDIMSDIIFLSDVGDVFDKLGSEGKNIKKISPYISAYENWHTIRNDDSSFKRTLATIDLASNAAIPVTMAVGIKFLPALLGLPFAYEFTKQTSRANYALSKLYDKMLPERQDKLDNLAWKYFEYPLRVFPKKVWEYTQGQLKSIYEYTRYTMDTATEQQLERVYKQLNDPKVGIRHNRFVYKDRHHERSVHGKRPSMQIDGPMATMKNMMDKATERQMERVQEKMENPNFHIQGNKFVPKDNHHERSSQRRRNQKKNATVLDLYSPTIADRDKVYGSRHGELISRQSNTSQNSHSVNNNNSFVINITGMNKTTAEIANELVPKLKYSLANMSLGAL